MKRIEYEKKEKPIRYCDNWENETCKAPTKERAEIKKRVGECQFCKAYAAKLRQQAKQREKQEHLRKVAEFEENKPEDPQPIKMEKLYSEREKKDIERRNERERLKIEKRKEKALEKAKTNQRKLKTKTKPIKKKNYSNIERKKEEYEAMEKYWIQNCDEFGGAYCEEYLARGQKVYIPHFHIGNVHHIATKKSLPEAAEDLENLCILSAEMHSMAHDNPHKMKLHNYFKEVIIKMKRKYSQFGDINILESKNKKSA